MCTRSGLSNMIPVLNEKRVESVLKPEPVREVKESKPLQDYEVMMLVMLDGDILEMNLVGDGFLALMLARENGKYVKKLDRNRSAFSIGYRTFELKNVVEGLKSLRVGMSLIEKGYFEDTLKKLEEIGTGELRVLFYSNH